MVQLFGGRAQCIFVRLQGWNISLCSPWLPDDATGLCVRSDDTYPALLAPPVVVVQGLQVLLTLPCGSLGYILQDLFLKRQVSRQLLQPAVLSLKLLQAFGLINSKPTVFIPPAIVTLLRRPGFLAGHGNCLALCLQHLNLAAMVQAFGRNAERIAAATPVMVTTNVSERVLSDELGAAAVGNAVPARTAP